MAARGVGASVCWAFLLFFQFSQLVTSTDITYRFQEEIPAGSKVGDIVEDAELSKKYTDVQVNNFEFRILNPESKGAQLFNITQTSGILQTRVKLDREAICPGLPKCEVSLGVVYTRADIFTVLDVLVEIVDINDNAPTFPERIVNLEIPESATPGASFNLPLARDLDSGLNGIQKYILQADVTNFELKVITIGSNNFPTTLQLVLKGQLDREVKPFYQVVVIATDGGEEPKSGALTINITVADANDHGPVFDNETYHVTILEDQPPGSRILRMEARDPDLGLNGRVLYKFVPGAADSNTDVFEMVENTGEVVLKNGLDYETKQTYHLIVEARDGGVNSQPAYVNVIIDVEDKNDNAPQISINTKNGSSDVATISESVAAGRFVAHISVKDPDTGLGGRFDCRVNDDHFFLQKITDGQYKIVTSALLDHEEKESYLVKVTCDDDGTPRLVSEKVLRVHIKDENDNSPIFSKSTFSVTFPENNYINEFILQVNATDADRGLNAALTYEIGLEGRDMFKIDPRSGVIRANGVFDYEKVKMYIFPVIAKDGGSPSRSGSALVSVSIADKNDAAPAFSKAAYTFDVLENQPVGMEIGIVSATDPDSGAFNYFEFSLQASKASENFAIDTISGHVRTKRVLDREQQGVHHMVVVASNVGITPPLSGSALITVNVLDQNDHAPIIDYPNERNYSVQISTQAPEGFLVALLQAHDVDTGNNARLTYAISAGNQDDLFSIDPSLGAISTKRSLAGMPDKLFDMKIRVSDQGFPPKYSTATLHVMLNSSIAYPFGSDPSKLLNGTNVTIVISLAIASGIVVIILIIAIVLIRKKEVGRRKQKHMYRYQIETQKTQPQNAECINEKSKSDKLKPPGGMRRNSQGSIGKSNNKKEVSFNMSNKGGSANDRKPVNTDHSMNNHTWSTTPDKGKNETKPKLQVPQKWEYTTAKIPGPSLVHGQSQGPHETSEALGGVPHMNGRKGTEGLISLPPQQKPWELYARELQTQYMLEKGGEDHDTDSAYSGDISNTDSGRGPSEEGEPGNPGAPFCTTSSGKPPQSGAPLSSAHVDTLQRLHKWQQPNNKHYSSQQQQQQGGPRYPSHHQGSNKMNNSNPMSKNSRNSDNLRPPSRSATPQKPLPPPRKSSARDSNPMAPPIAARGNYPQHPGHGFHNDNNWRTNNNSFKNWDTLPEEDDCASSTSGSYIVDPTDLYFEGSQPAVMV